MDILAYVGIASMALYYLSSLIMEDMPSLGYFMTFPLRLAFPIYTYHTYDSIEGLMIGSGLSLILSFENNIFWKLGVALLIGSELCHTAA